MTITGFTAYPQPPKLSTQNLWSLQGSHVGIVYNRDLEPFTTKSSKCVHPITCFEEYIIFINVPLSWVIHHHGCGELPF
jgi:hypothetical protein